MSEPSHFKTASGRSCLRQWDNRYLESQVSCLRRGLGMHPTLSYWVIRKPVFINDSADAAGSRVSYACYPPPRTPAETEMNLNSLKLVTPSNGITSSQSSVAQRHSRNTCERPGQWNGFDVLSLPGTNASVSRNVAAARSFACGDGSR